MASARIPRAKLNAAVHAMRVYLGSLDYASVRHQQRLYQHAVRACNAVAAVTGMSDQNVWMQVEAEARRQGILRPIPGQHI